MNDHPKNHYVLITGASSGIGEGFARRFAKEGWNLVLVARSRERLKLIQDEIKAAHSVDVHVIQSDLSQTENCKQVFEEVKVLGLSLDALVNNAGFGAVGQFQDVALDRQLEMIDVNIKALLHLTHCFLPAMVEQKKGLIINVSSTACFQPIPYFSVYSAAKAFVTSFSEALSAECRNSGVRVINLCPGRTETNFHRAAGIVSSPNDFRPAQSVDDVVNAAFSAMTKKGTTYISGFSNRAFYLLTRFFPSMWVASLVGSMAKKIGYVK